MRSLVLDELRPQEIEAAREYLNREARPSGIYGLYWIDLPLETLSENQRREAWKSGEGYRLAVEVGTDWVRFEMLARAAAMANPGAAQANRAQILFLVDWAEKMARKLNLSTCI